MKHRTERDDFGTKKVPSEKYFGIHTIRSLENFNISEKSPDLELFHSIAELKIAATKTNLQLKLLRKDEARAITKASQEILKGKFDNEFLVDIYQSGTATETHMNVNEVIANRAIELLQGKKGDYSFIHPKKHISMNLSQEDTINSAIKIASVKKLQRLVMELRKLERKTPSIKKDINRIQETISFLSRLNLADSGMNSYLNFKNKLLTNLKKVNRIQWKEARKLEENQSSFLEAANNLKILASNLIKISNDLKPYSQDKKTAETLNMVCLQVIGYEEAIAFGSQSEDAFTPLIAHNLLESIEILTNSIAVFSKIKVNNISKQTIEQRPLKKSNLDRVLKHRHLTKSKR